MEQINDRQLGVISDRIKQRFFPEIQLLKDLPAMVDLHHSWITENRTSIIQTISDIDTLKVSNTEIKNSLNSAIANIGNVGAPNSLWGNFGERAAFNAGYDDPDVKAMGEKRKFHFADVPINSIIQSEGFGQFTSQLISSIPIGEPFTPSPGPIIIPGDGFGAIPMSKGGKAKKLQVIDPGRFNIDPRFNYAGSIPVEGEVETFKYTLYELMNTRWGLSKQNSWRFFGATAKRMDDVNNRIKVFAPIEGVVKDIGDKWGSFSEMHKFLSDLGLTPTKFASDVWNVSGEFGNRIKQLLPEVDIKSIGSDLGTVKIPINLDRLWDGPLTASSGTSNTPLKTRTTGMVGTLINDFFNTGALRNELGTRITGQTVWGGIGANITGIGTNRNAINSIISQITADRTRLAGLESIIGTRPSGILGSIWDNIAALKKKITDKIDGIRSRLTTRSTEAGTVQGKAQDLKNDWQNWEMQKHRFDYRRQWNWIGGSWFVEFGDNPTFAELLSGVALLRAITSVNRDIDGSPDELAGLVGGRAKAKAQATADLTVKYAKFVAETLAKGAKNKIDNIFGDQPGSLLPGISNLKTNIDSDRAFMNGGGGSLSQPPTRTLNYNNQSQRPSVQHRNIGPYEVNIN